MMPRREQRMSFVCCQETTGQKNPKGLNPEIVPDPGDERVCA